MTVLELLLVTFTSAGVLLLAFFRRVSRSLWRSFAIAGVVLPLAVLIEGKHRALVLPMLLVAFIVAVLAFRRSRWSASALRYRYRDGRDS